MFKNVASQTVTIIAIDSATGKRKTGDASNITLYYNGDNGGVTVFSTGSGHPSEDDATNSPGTYTIAATQGETNFNKVVINGKSGTSGIEIVPMIIYTSPNRFSSLVIDSAGLADANTVKLGPSGSGTAQTARDIGTSVLLSSGTGTGQLKLASGYVAMTWADIAAPTTTVNLSGTTIAVTQKVDVDTIKTNAVVNGGTITFPTNATLASTTNITAGTITTTTNLTNGVNVTSWNGSAVAAPNVAGVPLVDTGYFKGTASAGAVGYVGLDWGHITAPTTTVAFTNTTIKTFESGGLADVKTQAVAALNTDTYAEPAQGAPAATTTLVGKIGFLYKAWRNKSTQTSSTYSLLNDDAATVDHKATVSDDGTTFTKGEVASGP